jgi:hypothetical protein
MIARNMLLCLLLASITATTSFTVVPLLRTATLIQRTPLPEHKKFFLQGRDDIDDDAETIVPYRDSTSTIDSTILPRDNNKLMLSSKVTVERTDAGSLHISIPEVGLQSSNLFELGFTASWIGIIGYMTMGMVRAGTGPVGALFTLPFWIAGASMANKSIVDPATSVRLTVGVYGWSMEKTLAGAKTKTIEGPTWQLEDAVVGADIEVNGKPLTCVQLDTGAKTYSFGHALSSKEKDWIAMEINEWLELNSDEIGRAGQVIVR